MKRRHFLAAGVAAALPLPAWAQAGGEVVLENNLWRVRIQPQNLAITVEPVGQAAVAASQGVATRAVSNLVVSSGRATWLWDGGHGVECRLDDRDFHVSITASEAGDLDLIDQPAAAFGKGMMLPLAEGHYVPAGDATWQAFILDRVNDVNTTEDLSLPLWGLDHGAFTLNWLLTNPFNNRLIFRRDGDGLALKVVHSFTSLAPTTPMTAILHLGEGDVVAGARRYRQYLIDNGSYESLSAKIAKTPEGAKLIGATQVYLWGNGLLGVNDVKDWPRFMKVLNGPSDLAVRLRATFEADTLAVLATAPAAWQKSGIVAAVNEGLNNLARQAWQNDSADNDAILAAYSALRAQVIALFGAALTADPGTWGDGLSAATVRALQGAGLQKLWIELGDGWEGGLWRPETVRDFVTAGYLIAPYDGYADTIKPGDRPDWVNAQLGKAIYEGAGVMKKDGSIVSGFVHAGYYTNSLTVMPMLKSRIAAVAKATGFNSWYIDVNASGMVFDDYRPGHEMTMAQNAEADMAGSRWVAETLGLPVQSECGNAVTAGGIMTAQGMQTPVMGWGDPALQKDTASPYYLGGWFPAGQPAIFFKPVPAMEPYRTIYFTPQTRLPLYQSVFHGSVITSSHWSYDRLKLTNVMGERDLAQLLYNVPPTYHLNAATLAERLPAMAKLDAVFRPLHEALALQAMDGFAWLSEDRLVQMTTFGDGSRLIANFADAAREAEGRNLPAMSLTALISGQTPRVFSL